MKGSRIKKVGNITISCMSVEARDLLNDLCETFKKEQKKDVHDVCGYTALYWACRWSGLIQRVEVAKE